MSEPYFETDELHPIDIVEHLAEHHEWDFDRVADDQITMVVAGQWRKYSITIALSNFDETLRLVSTFGIDPPAEKLSVLYETLNTINDQCWAGSLTYWDAHKLMVWRYGLVLAGGQIAGAEQIDTMIHDAVSSSERYYPALQLVCWGDETPAEAMGIAMNEAYGTA